MRFQNGQECGGAYIKLLSHQDKLDLVGCFLFGVFNIHFLPFVTELAQYYVIKYCVFFVQLL